MEKFIPYEKLSKKKQKELAKKQRKNWGSLHPVTRKSENPRTYNRQAEKRKTQQWSKNHEPVSFVFT